MRSKTIYQEEDSTFYSNGKTYDLNQLFIDVNDQPVELIHLNKLVWVLHELKEPLDEDRIAKANLIVPILVTHVDGRELVVDGIHRLSKAFKMNVRMLPYKRVSPKMMEHALL
jgi:hypothetical protein